MFEINKNYIRVKWLLGEGYIENINPSDMTDKIGTFSQTSNEQIKNSIQIAKSAQIIWKKTGLEKRH